MATARNQRQNMNRRAQSIMPAQTGRPTAGTTLRRTCATRRLCRDIVRAQSGFTIVEVMVAVIIFAVGLTAIAGMQTRSIEQSTLSDQMTMRVNALTHWAEALKRMPVKDETLELDGGVQIDVTVNGIFEEENMCDYGETCGWSYIDYEDKQAHTLRQRVTRDYPLPNLLLIELEVTPQGVPAATAARRTARVAYIRSTRWN